ncbi:MAG: NADH-quinone oxidoreductase subunit J, partial [Gammaproteobacteria bacterium]
QTKAQRPSEQVAVRREDRVRLVKMPANARQPASEAPPTTAQR